MVGTHEHWDHLSGFLQAEQVFAGIKIDQVWLPWTEDPADEQAQRLSQERKLALAGLRAIAARLAGRRGRPAS